MQDYLDGYLLASQRRELESHLAGCESCRRELLMMKNLEERLVDSGDMDVPPGFGDSVSRLLPRGPQAQPWMRAATRAAGLGLSVATAVLLAVLVIYSPARRNAGIKNVELVFFAPTANAVNVVGDFNDWSLGSHAMSRNADGTWRLAMKLQPGLYQYNFYIDHRFWADNPGTQAMVSDGFGGRNAILFVEG